jgi:hypothetical protein
MTQVQPVDNRIQSPSAEPQPTDPGQPPGTPPPAEEPPPADPSLVAQPTVPPNYDRVVSDRESFLLAQAAPANPANRPQRSFVRQEWGEPPPMYRPSAQQLGPNIAGDIRNGMINQLRFESRLNAQSDPAASRFLTTGANVLQNTPSRFPQGTYNKLADLNPNQDPNPNSRFVTRSYATDLRNPVEVSAFSATPDAMVARVEQLNGQILERQQRLREVQSQRAGSFGAGPLGVARQTSAEAGLMGEIRGLTGQRDKLINDARLQASRGNETMDPALRARLGAVNNANGDVYLALADPKFANNPPVIFVNGVNTDKHRSAMEALELSARMQCPVYHVVNVSSRDGLQNEIGNISADPRNVGRGENWNFNEQRRLDQRLQQHLSSNIPAATMTQNAILDQMYNSTGPIRLVGYSQGAAISTQALRGVDAHLQREVVAGRLTPDQKREMLGRVNFLSIGGAADPRHLTADHVRAAGQGRPGDGVNVPRPDLGMVNFSMFRDVQDPIPRLLGVGNSRADGAAQLGTGADVMLGRQSLTPHLTYFEHYRVTDNVAYNTRMDRLYSDWYNSPGQPTTVLLDSREDQMRRVDGSEWRRDTRVK